LEDRGFAILQVEIAVNPVFTDEPFKAGLESIEKIYFA